MLVMKKEIVEREEDLVEEFKIGNVHIKIYDTYCKNKTPEEIQVILDRCSYIASEALSRQKSI
ncbi:hypothetical protein Cst_c21450 [Thermoclostridium stercorarium subsp. stercorarium DSM 8532]|uniref:Uncharacterized protein n=2 Tax=Thermoclostridium stercorarium TaxID=1510 RepID=L7VRY0_THES1|nr:hypothetical protein Cst_c21450 [Thermoclostridium stercorarium subsp. stercorarium DSM 8532]